MDKSSIESQKGINAIQQCSVETRRVVLLYKLKATR